MSNKKHWRPYLSISLKEAISNIFQKNEHLKEKYEGNEANYLKHLAWDKLKSEGEI